MFGIVAFGPFGAGPHGYFGAAMGYLRAQFPLERPLRSDGCGRCRALGPHRDQVAKWEEELDNSSKRLISERAHQ